MAAAILHDGATVMCMHTGDARPAIPDQRVTVSGQKVTTPSAMYTVSRCTLPPNAGGPCASVQWVSAATRVRASGRPVLLTDSSATCIPTGTGVQVVSSQRRVSAS